MTTLPVAYSPFIQAAILDILNDAIEKSMESGYESNYIALHRYLVCALLT
jgi:hypothetical protein